MPELSHLDLFKATIEHKKHDKFLFYASFTPDLERKILTKFNFENIGQFYNKYDVPFGGNIDIKMKERDQETLFSRYFDDIKRPEGAYIDILGAMHVPGSSFHFTRMISPLRNAEGINDILGFPFPDLQNISIESLRNQVDEYHRQGKAVSCAIGHMYEWAWGVRGYEEFLMDMKLNPEICDYILDNFCSMHVKKAELAAMAGVDMIQTADDVANQLSMMFAPEIWRRYIKPRWAKIYNAARRIKPDIQIWYHSDGNITDIIPELIEIGVTILNPLQPECLDVTEVKRQYGRHLVFDGTIGTQTTLPFGTADEVKNIIRKRKQEIGYDGALIISPTHILEPEVPIENVTAFFEACSEI